MRNLAGRVAVVTGGGSGIGLGIARALLSAGMKVVLIGRREEVLHEAVQQLRGSSTTDVHAIRADVTDRAALSAAAAEIQARFGKVHLLCNSAGVNILGPADEATFDDWDWVLDVNLGGVVNATVTFLPLIKAHGEGGYILNVASMGSFIAGAQVGPYTASKFAVRGLSESLRYSLARHRIGVSLLCPGLTRSRIFEASLRRPERLSQSGVVLTTEMLNRMESVHATGMDPDEVGRRALQGILENRMYIFSHAEFRDELQESFDELLQAFPQETPDTSRSGFEEGRRRAKREAAEAAARLD